MIIVRIEWIVTEFHTFLILVDGPMGSEKTSTTKLINTELPETARIAFPDMKRLVPSYKENENTIPVRVSPEAKQFTSSARTNKKSA
jgi:type IV secretory pathway ATPase VirB11/archaellum biosynthesis ATPase